MAKCKAPDCGKQIMFAHNPTRGRPAIPLDVAPTASGRYWLDRGVARVADASTPPDANRFDPHFVTCPAAKAFRKRGRRR